MGQALTPQQFQIYWIQVIERLLQGMIADTRSVPLFEVITFLKRGLERENTCLAKVFRVDQRGEVISQKSRIRGFQIFEVEVGFPNSFSFSTFQRGKKFGHPRYCMSPEALQHEVREAFLDILCHYCMASLGGRG